MNAQIHAQLESAGELHARSMELADRALVLRLEGSGSESRSSLEQAFELERDSADLLSATDVPALRPWRFRCGIGTRRPG